MYFSYADFHAANFVRLLNRELLCSRRYPRYADTPTLCRSVLGRSDSVHPCEYCLADHESFTLRYSCNQCRARENKGQGREQSESEKPAKKRTDEVEK